MPRATALLSCPLSLSLLLALSASAQAIEASATLPAARATPASAPSPQGDRYIVRWREDARLSSAQARDHALRRVLRASGLAARSTGLAAVPLRVTASGAQVVRLSRRLDEVESAALLRTFAADPAVAHAEPDLLLHHDGLRRTPPVRLRTARAGTAANPDDPYYAQYQWHFHDVTGGIRAPAAWNGATGEGVVVAVLDTGVTAHPDLDANMLEGYDFITDAFVSRRDGDARAAGGADLGDWNDDPAQCPVSDSSWHGTHVAGTVGEVTGTGVGMAGVAHDAKVLPVRVLGRCGGYLSDIADAVVWASGGAVDGVPANANPAEVINMSLTGAARCDAGSEMQLAVDAAIANGTTVVVAAGNDGADAGFYTPASCDGVVAVGATRITGGRTDYSNFGQVVDLAAPGGGGMGDGDPSGYVWQAWHDSATAPVEGGESYVGYIGTSMASPHVAAVAALVQGAAATPLAPGALRDLLVDSARPFPVSIPADTPIGAGIVDAAAAVAAVQPPCEGEDCAPDASPIVNGVPVRNLAGATGDALLFALEVPEGATGLDLLSYGGNGNVTLLASRGVEPEADDAEYRSARPGNNETIRVAMPAAGTWYVKLVGEASFRGVTLQARHR